MYFGELDLRFDSQVVNKVANEVFLTSGDWYLVQAGLNY